MFFWKKKHENLSGLKETIISSIENNFYYVYYELSVTSMISNIIVVSYFKL